MSTSNDTNANRARSATTPPIEPAYRTEVIETLNKSYAKSKEGIYLRLPQPNPRGHLRLFKDFKWTKPQVDRFFADGTLPHDISTIPSHLTPADLDIWIFDGRGSTGDSLPEIEADPLPDLEHFPALVIFDFGIPEWLCMMPPGALRWMSTGQNKGRFVLKPGAVPIPTTRKFPSDRFEM
ncbi:hypothetical protein VTO58DRAFT_109376 [Aureobasidium pullulans]|nr:hypothetical protein JADG_010717 [Aureobasidium pullulans]